MVFFVNLPSSAEELFLLDIFLDYILQFKVCVSFLRTILRTGVVIKIE